MRSSIHRKASQVEELPETVEHLKIEIEDIDDNLIEEPTAKDVNVQSQPVDEANKNAAYIQ